MSEETSKVDDKKSLKRKFKEINRSKEAKKPPMPVYGKYNILKMLKENHCLIADEEQLVNAFPRNKRYDLDDIKGFVNKTAQRSQAITEKSNKTKEFKRANDLVKCIEECDSPNTERNLDIPLSLKTITDVFNYTDEEVDVRMLYQTLTNFSLGFPTCHMDQTTNDFLYGVYKEFIDQVHTPEFQEDVKRYQKFFNGRASGEDDRPDVKHPTDFSDMEFVVRSTFNCPSMNPLNIPYSLLNKPKDSV
ncbi:uncharacterized protein LOC119075672 [Bradysia coprophila]|uniref:uncharacterized protein LOC119075672 n=1 Tax=Bradysia coprophila TaxID=38358 RepID=UPI00187DC265|nr:uncharacterized protein LOC119075672 [Bradysia coprophila]